MTVQEQNTLHTVCELERNQLLTILAMSVQNPQFAGFLLSGNRNNFLYVECSTAWLYDCPDFFLLYTKLNNASIVYLYTSKILLCTPIQLQDKLMTMKLLLHVIKTQETSLN